MRYDDRLIRVADHYGFDSQSRQLIEEMAELTAAINRFWRKRLKCGAVKYTAEDEFRQEIRGTKEWSDLIAEVADVEVCLMQLRYMLDADGMIDLNVEYKIRRQIYRMNLDEWEEWDGLRTNDNRRLAGDQGQDQERTE